MLDSVVGQELHRLVGCEGEPPVRGELLGDAVSGEELSKPLPQLGRGATACSTELNGWPTTEPVHDHEVVVTARLEVVCCNLLEGIVWLG